MPLSEFALIRRYFTAQTVRRDDVVLGVGDDCALLRVPEGMELAVSIDTMVEGVHFPAGTDPGAVGHKALAVSLSDLAAMGAEPAWATLSLSIPEPDEVWLAPFAAGLLALAQRHAVQLVGGDTVRGPLTVTTQLHGFVPEGQALRRRGAQPGDRIYVTGTLGDAGAGLRVVRGELSVSEEAAALLRRRLDRPEPRVREGRMLRGMASAAIDISDGLAADLEHILEAGGVGATLDLERLPLSDPLREAAGSEEAALGMALCAGDDYELCFTVPSGRTAEAEVLFRRFGSGCTCIGRIEEQRGLRLQRRGEPFAPAGHGFDHFLTQE